jgi:hypothetical protein
VRPTAPQTERPTAPQTERPTAPQTERPTAPQTEKPAAAEPRQANSATDRAASTSARFTDRVAVVTAGAQEISAATDAMLVAGGASVAVVDLTADRSASIVD